MCLKPWNGSMLCWRCRSLRGNLPICWCNLHGTEETWPTLSFLWPSFLPFKFKSAWIRRPINTGPASLDSDPALSRRPAWAGDFQLCRCCLLLHFHACSHSLPCGAARARLLFDTGCLSGWNCGELSEHLRRAGWWCAIRVECWLSRWRWWWFRRGHSQTVD